jgi:hypothetical protein
LDDEGRQDDDRSATHSSFRRNGEMKRGLYFIALLGACVRPATRAPVSAGGSTRAVDYCEMAAVVLGETVKSNADQPYGLEDVCVHRLASLSGRTYVDVRFGDGPPPSTATTACVRDPYAIRFDVQGFQQSPAQGVVLLMISAEKNGARDFSAIVEEPNWPARRPEVLAMSPCGSAFGSVRLQASGWSAHVVPPPRSPDAL